MGTKSRFSKAALVGAAGAAAAALAVAGTAWACSPSATVSVAPSEGRPGSTVTVEGNQFSGTVEIRWSAGDRVLARTSGPSFSVAVQIPSDAAPGVTYYIVGIGQLADGREVGKNQAPFYITGTSGSTSTQTEPSGQRKTSGSVAGGSSSSEPQSEPAEVASPPAADASPSPAPSAERSSSAPVADESTVGARVERPVGSGSQPGAESGRASTATPKVSPAPAQGTPVSANAPAAVHAAPVADEEAERALAPSGRSQSADLWSGFQSGSDGARGPSLIEQAPASDGGSQLSAGIAMLSVGLLALAVGAGAAVTRRKAVRARRH